jgi:hypothetical protein
MLWMCVSKDTKHDALDAGRTSAPMVCAFPFSGAINLLRARLDELTEFIKQIPGEDRSA